MQSQHIDIIGRVFEWNERRGLLERGYSLSLESSFVAEELSELLRAGGDEVEAIDAHIDSIIFQLGALSKILGSKEAMQRCFDAVLTANEAKGTAKDASGKIIKNKTAFIEPQEVIKAVLDEVRRGV